MKKKRKKPDSTRQNNENKNKSRVASITTSLDKKKEENCLDQLDAELKSLPPDQGEGKEPVDVVKFLKLGEKSSADARVVHAKAPLMPTAESNAFLLDYAYSLKHLYGVQFTLARAFGVLSHFCLRGGFIEAVDLNFEFYVNLDGKKITFYKRDIMTSFVRVCGHKFLRRYAEDHSREISNFACLNGLRGDRYKAVVALLPPGEKLSGYAAAHCASFNQNCAACEEAYPAVYGYLQIDFRNTSARLALAKAEAKAEAKERAAKGMLAKELQEPKACKLHLN